MMMLLGTYVRRWRRILRRWMADPELRMPLEMGGSFLLGLCLSAASLGNSAQPFCMAVLCAGLHGWLPAAYAIGSAMGYWLFWGVAGLQCVVWIAASLPVCVLLGQRKIGKQMPLLLPSMAALIVAACGVIFQQWRGDDTSIAMYLLRIALAFGGTALVMLLRRRTDPAAQWVAMGVGVLALAQLAPLPFLDLGVLAAGMLVTTAPLPAVAMAGLALDLAQVTPVPMTAVLCLSALLRLLPRLPKGWSCAAPAAVYLIVMGLCGQIDPMPLPALLLGGALGVVIPQQPQILPRRGETGFAQVRLEMAAGVLAQSEQLLLETRECPIDEGALIAKAADRACGTCPCRKGCKELEAAKKLPEALLHRPLIDLDDVPVSCKKRGRLMLELRRGQDQYRILKADRDRQQEYRSAVIQQYRFLSEYLQDLADLLPRRGREGNPRFQPELAVCSSGKELANGDRCMWFAGTECRYYLLLCDGMGVGMGAAEEANSAGNMLRRLLMAGYPAPYALRSMNSLCTLRGRAGAVTLDLAEIQLDTGRVSVYKWGAAPSWLLVRTGAERIGTAGPPPGLSVADTRETVDRLSLGRGEILVMLSDGVDSSVVVNHGSALMSEPPGTLAARILDEGVGEGADDATVAVVRLRPVQAREAWDAKV